MAKVIANVIRPNNIIEHQGKLWRVVKIDHTQPGKGGAFNQMTLQALESNTKLNERFRASEKIEQVRLEQHDYTFLFEDGDMVTLMDEETYEQFEFNKSVFGDKAIFLQDGLKVTIESYDERPIGAEFPAHVIFTIVETEAVVKGQTAASSNKPAICDNGHRIMVPPFIETGERVVIRTEDGEYVERAKD
jgi:elongation factor P